MTALLAAALTFVIVFWGVWEFLEPWRKWGDAALWPQPARKWMNPHA